MKVFSLLCYPHVSKEVLECIVVYMNLDRNVKRTDITLAELDAGVLSPHKFKASFSSCFAATDGATFTYPKLEALHAWDDQVRILGPPLFQNTKGFE